MSIIETNEVENNETTTAPELKNDKRKADFNKAVRKLGEEAGLGKDSLPKLAHIVCRAANEGVINADDAQKIYERYADAEGAKTIHEHSNGSAKAQISKLRQIISLGAMTTVDGVEVLQNAFELMGRVKDVKNNPKYDGWKTKSAYPFYVDVARAQIKSPDAALDMDELEGIIQKPEAAPKELEKVLEGVMKKLEKLVAGEGELKDDHELTEAAYNAIKERLEAFTIARNKAALRAKAAELGLSLVA